MALENIYHITIDDSCNGIGSSCPQYDQYLHSAASKYSVVSVARTMTAMQESSCNADAGGPTPGLIQVSCENYPNGRCTVPIQDNVNAGTN
jgi:hypothetical protein